MKFVLPRIPFFRKTDEDFVQVESFEISAFYRIPYDAFGDAVLLGEALDESLHFGLFFFVGQIFVSGVPSVPLLRTSTDEFRGAETFHELTVDFIGYEFGNPFVKALELFGHVVFVPHAKRIGFEDFAGPPFMQGHVSESIESPCVDALVDVGRKYVVPASEVVERIEPDPILKRRIPSSDFLGISRFPSFFAFVRFDDGLRRVIERYDPAPSSHFIQNSVDFGDAFMRSGEIETFLGSREIFRAGIHASIVPFLPMLGKYATGIFLFISSSMPES